MDTSYVSEEPDTSLEPALKRCLMPKSKLAIIAQGADGETEYLCVECPARYCDKGQLEVHLCTHYSEYRFLCGLCGTGLKRKEHLDRHLLGHQEIRPHACPDCGKAFKRKEHLNIHKAIHGDRSQCCPLCNRSFHRKDHLQKHLQTHSKMFEGGGLLTEELDIKNEAEDEEEMDEEIPCQIVMEIDDVNDLMIDQQLSLESSRMQAARPHACPVCHKTYKRKDHLKLHSYSHLEKDKICSECGKAFHREDQLASHMSVHMWKSHMKPGVDIPPASVPPSGIRILPVDESLLVPRQNFSPSAEGRPHQCPICQRRFKRKQHLKVHSSVHTKRRNVLEAQATIWCSLCNEGFHNNYQFERHQCIASNQYNNTEHNNAEYNNAEYNDAEYNNAEYVAAEYNNAEYIDAEYRMQPMRDVPQDAKKENNYPPEFVEVTDDGNVQLLNPIPILSLGEEHLPTPARVYVCKFCQKPFKRKDHYKIHLHIHTGVKSFFCVDCGKGFYRKDHLQKHSQVHLKEKPRLKPRAHKKLPDLYPIGALPHKEVKPEITITAPSNTKLRVPLQIKVPYQVVTCSDDGEQRTVTIHPRSS